MIDINKNYVSEILKKKPDLSFTINEIENIDFNAEILKLNKLTNYTLENNELTNSHMNGVIVYTTYRCVFGVIEAKQGFNLLFKKGLLSPAFVLNRLIFELWAAACFVENAIREFRTSRDEEMFNKIANKLFSGSKHPVKLPSGKQSTEKPVDERDMRKILKKHYPEANDTYNFLCEYCHPNCLYAMEAFIASNSEDFNNPLFEKEITRVLKKQLSTLEKSLTGIKECANAVSDMCLEEYGINFP